MSGLALVAVDATTHPRELAGTPFARLGDRRVAAGLVLAALGEMGADKLPSVPARIARGPLAGRLVLGGLAGAAACLADDRSALGGAAVGVASTFLASHVLYRLRRAATQRLHLPDFVPALLEDAAVVSLGSRLVRRA